MINWNTINHFNDSNFNWQNSKETARLPGYVNDNSHPFTYCNSMTNVNPVTGAPNIKHCMGDGPELFNKNLGRMPKDWKYRTKHVEYKVNSSGYRTREWNEIDWKNSIVIFGCSCTFGVGLNEDETISFHLEQTLGRPVINLGYPSGSNNLILNNAVTCLEKYGIPWGVVVNWTTTDRFRFYGKNNYVDLGPWNSPDNKHIIENDVNLNELWMNFYFDTYNENASNYYIGRTMAALWKDRTRYCSISYFEQAAHMMRAEKFFYIYPDDRARDVIHPGERNSIEIANYITDKFK